MDVFVDYALQHADGLVDGHARACGSLSDYASQRADRFVNQHLLFFFQAEDGIREESVTGVQTCALPIWPARTPRGPLRAGRRGLPAARADGRRDRKSVVWGKRGDLGGRRIIKKKQKLVMAAAADQLAVVEDQYLVGVPDGGHPVGDDVFLQAEDGIRESVTGVQTCALPI